MLNLDTMLNVVHMLFNMLISSHIISDSTCWSTVDQLLDWNQHVDQLSIKSWSIQRRESTCWSTVEQQISILISIMLINNWSTSWIYSTSWSTIDQQVDLKFNMLINIWSTSWFEIQHVDQLWPDLEGWGNQHVDQQLINFSTTLHP